MELDLGGMFEQNFTYDYKDYEYKEDCTPPSGGFMAAFIPVLYSLVVVLGLLGHVLVLLVLFHKNRTVMDIFILHLSMADVLLLLTMPLWAVEAANEWIFSTGACKLSGALFKINFYYGIFLLACISLDRYLSIVHGVMMLSSRRPLVIWLICIAVFFFSVLLSIPDWIYLIANSNASLGGKTACIHSYRDRWRLALRLLYHVVGFLIPSMVLFYCYSCILLRRQKGCQGLQKLQAMRIILALVVVFFICWMPYNITLLVDTIQSAPTDSTGQFEGCRHSKWTAVNITEILGFLHCCLNPFIYFGLSRKFRLRVLSILRCDGWSLHSRDVSLWELEQVDERASASPEEKGSLNQMNVLGQTTESQKTEQILRNDQSTV
ncbi:C-X-C chemokine receptor type 3-like [Pygocentrus nattereri]|uniref:G-protein coupled receptors family 1 profile domain-containing protein n=1 Tax=Pygocentrus nattereri TaxID=42514 RepID=A0A3B4CQR7_PYGNA|nr:C-X-C chemokine receptor type 3-like [Pygocentrus nattereri]XP_017561579.1 C-X-C chemokine receptor type 3-like [Pygocentrus nattereri]XP_017561580.1 C-X-C chemokine receptor type 3-like [Pygocentrus nattereri]